MSEFNGSKKLKAPFPYFGGKSLACDAVWSSFGDIKNYVEPFAGSAAMLLGAPEGKRVETINDADGFVANFWRSIASDAEAVAFWCDWPVNEVDLFSRHSWLVRAKEELLGALHGDPLYYDVRIAGWWVWGSCVWIGSGFCSGEGPWVHDGDTIVDRRVNRLISDAGLGINRQRPHLSNVGQGIHRKRPHLSDAGLGIHRKRPQPGNAGQGINRETCTTRSEFIHDWFSRLQHRLRDVRVTCGDWKRVTTKSVTTGHGSTGIFLDPPYTTANLDYAAGGVGGELADEVRAWCVENGGNEKLRIVLCGHTGEHDELLQHGWHIKTWKGRRGMANSKEANERRLSETLWCSPYCVKEQDNLVI